MHDGYGQTETGALTGMPIGEPIRPGSMGRALPGLPAVDRGRRAVRRPGDGPDLLHRRPGGHLAHRRPGARGRGRLPLVRGPHRRRDHLGRLPDRAVRGGVGAGLPSGGGRGRRRRGARRGARAGGARRGGAARRIRGRRRSWRGSCRSTSRGRPRPTSTRASSSSPTRCRRRRAGRSGGRRCGRTSLRSRCRTASPTRPRPTSSSTRTTRSTGTPGARRRSPRAREQDRPILLSIGYSACHWCHVMERESFEDERHGRLHERALRARSSSTARSDPTSTPSTWRRARR